MNKSEQDDLTDTNVVHTNNILYLADKIKQKKEKDISDAVEHFIAHAKSLNWQLT